MIYNKVLQDSEIPKSQRQFRYLFVEPKTAKKLKKCSNVADSATNLICPVADSAYNAQNAQFGLVM